MKGFALNVLNLRRDRFMFYGEFNKKGQANLLLPTFLPESLLLYQPVVVNYPQVGRGIESCKDIIPLADMLSFTLSNDNVFL